LEFDGVVRKVKRTGNEVSAEDEESPLLKAVTRERLMKTQTEKT
jgi:hypothetical protein